MSSHPPDRTETIREFGRVVNMTPAALRKWLASNASRAVGMIAGGERVTNPEQGESVGHHMGERIVEIKGKRRADLTDEDLADMRKVIGYVHRHTAQRPQGDVTDTRWRKSLMNWGHDPLR